MKMKQKENETLLSAFLDGELDTAAMSEADQLLDKDETAKKYVLETVRTTAFLRANMKDILYEESPKRLLETLNEQKKSKFSRLPTFPSLIRLAAVLILGFLGFGSGVLLERSNVERFPVSINPLPAAYCEVVDNALEYNLSGTPQKWRSPGGIVDVTVTPVKTYRDKNGVYFREYQLEVSSGTDRSKIIGLAYRKLKGEWETKTLSVLNNKNTT
jgi:hypothetical protein